MLLSPMPELGEWLCEQLGCELKEELQTATISSRTVAFSVASDAEQVKQLP